jgi:hypothetical protein
MLRKVTELLFMRSHIFAADVAIITKLFKRLQGYEHVALHEWSSLKRLLSVCCRCSKLAIATLLAAMFLNPLSSCLIDEGGINAFLSPVGRQRGAADTKVSPLLDKKCCYCRVCALKQKFYDLSYVCFWLCSYSCEAVYL